MGEDGDGDRPSLLPTDPPRPHRMLAEACPALKQVRSGGGAGEFVGPFVVEAGLQVMGVEPRSLLGGLSLKQVQVGGGG